MPLTLADLNGYTDRDLDDDLARWFADRPAVAVGDEVRPVGPFLDRLPPAAADALAAFDRRVRSGAMPEFMDIFDWSYGFDFAGNDCGILDADYETEVSDEDVWSLAADGNGSLYVLLADGRVAVWFNEEEVLEGHTRFDNLDVFLWSMVRYHAVRAGVLERAAVEADFLALNQAGAVEAELGLLRSMK